MKTNCILLAVVASMTISCTRAPDVEVVEDEWMRVDRIVPNAPPPEIIWQGEPLVHPRGVMLDADANVIYVTDPGEPVRDPIGQPARIVTFQIRNGVPTDPEIFFSRPGYMISAKWGFPVTVEGQRQILVADQGEAADEYSFSGVGAKVFSIPVLRDGSAGEPRILWEGEPFVCPTGIAAIGDIIYITDPCAGPVRTRPERPDHEFVSSAIFALRLSRNEPPILLKSGAPFTSLIGICIGTPGEIIVNDTDSGRIDPMGVGGRPGFAPPAGADRWVLKILDEERPTLSDPVRTPFLEEGPVTLEFSRSLVSRMSKTSEPIRVRTNGSATFMPHRTISETDAYLLSPTIPINEVEIDSRLLAGEQRVMLNVASDVMEDAVTLDVDFPGRGQKSVTVKKSQTMLLAIQDNKHGGSIFGGGGFGGGGAGGSFRYTADNVPGHGAIHVYVNDGGSFAVLAKGDPLGRPVSGQLSADGAMLWIVDQEHGTLLALPFPSVETFLNLFPQEESDRN